MPRLPRYPRKAHSSGQARVKWAGEVHYLGKFGTPESYATFGELMQKITASLTIKATEQPVLRKKTLTINQLCAAFIERNKSYYATNKDERHLIGYALRPLVKLYGPTLANEFGPLAFQRLREHMLTLGHRDTWSRGYINSQCNRVKRMFRWGVSQELVKADVLHGLEAVSPLLKGKCDARETKPIKPVEAELIAAVKPFCNRQVRAMLELQEINGMRSAELVQIRGELVDMASDRGLWIFELIQHKNGWRGQTQKYLLGKKAQALLKPFVKADPAEHWFSPAEAKRELHDSRAKRPEADRAKKRVADPKRRPGAAYTTRTYRRHIYRALVKLREAQQVDDRFHPNQVRHTTGTEIRKLYGTEAARVALGHARLSTTELYAERDFELAKRIARERG
jgi:site-specific recombinase XerC